MQEIDPNCFIVIHEVKEVVGGRLGFINDSAIGKEQNNF
nr:DUF2179 domain-containing protein [Bacillus paralicheniformis]